MKEISPADGPPGESGNAATRGAPSTGLRAETALAAGVAAFAATTGALLTFGARRGGAFSPFAAVGARIARDVALPAWGDVALGVAAHLGQSLVLGVAAAALSGRHPYASRLRGALIVVILWQVAALVPWFAAVRADLTLSLGPVARIGFSGLLAAALALGARSAQR